jgi:hypothetical protein
MFRQAEQTPGNGVMRPASAGWFLVLTRVPGPLPSSSPPRAAQLLRDGETAPSRVTPLSRSPQSPLSRLGSELGFSSLSGSVVVESSNGRRRSAY